MRTISPGRTLRRKSTSSSPAGRCCGACGSRRDRGAYIAANLVRVIGNRLAGGPCRVFGSDFKVRSPTGNARYPDVMIKCSGPAGKSLFTTEPRVLVEVLSPSNEALDQFRLLEDYKAFTSVEQIAFVAQDKPQALLWTRGEKDWVRADLDGMEATLELSGLGLSIPFTEIYEGVTFETE